MVEVKEDGLRLDMIGSTALSEQKAKWGAIAKADEGTEDSESEELGELRTLRRSASDTLECDSPVWGSECVLMSLERRSAHPILSLALVEDKA